MRKSLTALLTLGLAVSGVSLAAPVAVNFWDFFGGGDGVRMKAIVDNFNKSQSDIVVTRTTQVWGVPFYTKVHTAVVAGDTPDMITYHLSHMPQGMTLGDLREFTTADITAAGLAMKDFQPSIVKTMNDIAKNVTGKAGTYALPLDTHTYVVYYNKDLLKKAGLLGADGTPTGLTGVANFTKALQTIKTKTGVLPISFSTAQDTGTPWRLWDTLFLQQGGNLVVGGKLNVADLDTKGKVALQTMVDWTKQGLLAKNSTYPAMVALFTAGRAAFMMNGNWEAPTLVDLKAAGKLKFDFGMMAFPKLFVNNDTWADSHVLAIPTNTKKPLAPEKLSAVLKFMGYIEKTGGLTWAGGGHVPAYVPTRNLPDFKSLSPNNQYSDKAASQIKLDPILTYFGVGNSVYDSVGNNLTPALLGQGTVDKSIGAFKADLQKFDAAAKK